MHRQNNTFRGVLAAILFLLPVGLTGCEVFENAVRSISDGAPCTTDDNCLGNTCLTAQDGFPNGYCTTLQCDTQGCSNLFGAECLVVNQTRGEPICYATCRDDDDCGRDGYACVDADGTGICLPGAIAATFPSAGDTGTSCTRDLDCDGGTCLQNYTGGYCTTVNCTSDNDCAAFGDGRCLTQGADTTLTSCFDGCSSDTECRFGYGCTDPDGGGGVCDLLDQSSPIRNPNGADDGQPCLVDINCKGGTCLRDAEGYPGGYCSTLSCTLVGCNGANAQCVSLENNSACFVSCSDNAQCREGYECLAAGYCAPPISTSVPSDPSGTIDIICESQSDGAGRRRFNFNIDASTVAFAVVPFSNTNAVRPRQLLLPSGSVGADFDGNYAFLNINYEILVNIAPAFFPAAPQFATIVQQGGGMYSLTIDTDDPNPCFYVLEKPGLGSSIALNIYLVGVPGVTTASAANDSNMNQVIDQFEQIYSNAGITLATVRFLELDSQGTQRYQLIRDLNEVSELLSESEAPGPTLADQLSINVFLIQDFAIPQYPGLLGISGGAPGVPGLHGNHGAGLVFSSASLGWDNASLGQTMAHEVGHFNGLRHTTEHDGSLDPISDTPSCNDPNAGANCPDATNFMFPFGVDGISQTIVTQGQALVLQSSPLVQ